MELVSQYRQKFANPYVAAQKGYIDEVIEPAETRPKLISALESLIIKRDLGRKKTWEHSIIIQK
jgi:acetyl-CoA carboxylase carboxyltransferase component